MRRLPDVRLATQDPAQRPAEQEDTGRCDPAAGHADRDARQRVAQGHDDGRREA